MKYVVAPAIMAIIACSLASAARADVAPPPPPPPPPLPSCGCFGPNAPSGPLQNYCEYRCSCGCNGTAFYINITIPIGNTCNSSYFNQALEQAQQFGQQNPSYVGPCEDEIPVP